MTDTQGTPEWFAARCGKVTASRIADVVAKTKSGWGASRATYMGELIAERLTGMTAPSYTNAAMQWGVETEPQARAAYEFYSDAKVELVGFVDHPTIAMTGASPDGLVGSDGLVEFKCPNTITHIETLLGNVSTVNFVPEKYFNQMQWQMACTGRQWCDFVSFDPRMPESMRTWIRRLHRDDAVIKSLEEKVQVFLNELDEKVSGLKEHYEKAQAA